MPRSDLVINLVKAGLTGDTADVRSTAEAIAADERAKKHAGVADRITRALLATKPVNGHDRAGQNLRVRDGSGGIYQREPGRALDELQLDQSVRAACQELIEEQHGADVLRASGLEPRHRLLLAGPPGNGKTSLAEALAYELALPWFTVRYDAVVTSYLGETAQRLRRLFDYVRTQPCLLFFDEFDAIGKERGDIHETGEIKRVVTTLLLQMDDLPSYCVLVGATNHPELLDRATWRRFELRLELDRPTIEDLKIYFTNHLSKLGYGDKRSVSRLVEAVAPESYSDAEDFFLDVERRVVLSQGAHSLDSIIESRLKALASRKYLPGSSLNRA